MLKNRIKTLSCNSFGLVSLALLSESSFAQIAFGPVSGAAQQVPLMSSAMMAVLALISIFFVYHFLRARDLDKTAMVVAALGLLGAFSLGGYNLVTDAQAGGEAYRTPIDIDSQANSSHAIEDGYNTFTNNSGITLEVKSIAVGTCTISSSDPGDVQCTVGLKVSSEESCTLDAAGC